ncbi:AcrR family transcriptional regulator [Filimonas zeae]|nr:TetR/AcrR family transcriptional regulator [Filimonas zeae]MDR6337720.1 AcrR family transcriptional regulator [Filimonas zeae]
MHQERYHIANSGRLKLLKVAEALFAQYGFDGASTRLITEESGMNVSMVNYYFGSKEALYLAIFESRLKQLKEELAGIDDLALKVNEKLEYFLRAFILRIQQNPGFYRMLCMQTAMAPHPGIKPLLLEARALNFRLLRKIVISGIDEGYFKQVDVDLFVFNVFNLLPAVFSTPAEEEIQLLPFMSGNAGDDLSDRMVAYIMSSFLTTSHPSKQPLI